MVAQLARCRGIVVVHRDLSLTCTQNPCSACELHAHGSDAWLFAHTSYYGCDFVLGHLCPRCWPVQQASTRDLHGATEDRSEVSD